MPRQIRFCYQDPVDVIWLHAARQCGIRVQRDSRVFAAWDGRGLLKIGTRETLDQDDSLAQMILHEICHALVAGPESFQEPDWGLDYDNPEHQICERACLRLQAALADEFELRPFLASTTDFREYFDRLPVDPLATDGDPATPLARAAWQELRRGPWQDPIRQALQRTKAIADVVGDIAPDDSLWSVRQRR